MFSNVRIRNIHTGLVKCHKIVLNNLKGKSKSSQDWLIRQSTDPYVEKAKMLNYRCRSAFKLLEIDEKVKILQPGQVVIDCGGAPGSWTQVAVEKTNAHGNDVTKNKGFVISLDLLQIYPITGAQIIGNADFREKKTQDKVKRLLNGRLVDCVLSDMAPNSTGVKSLDQENITILCYTVLRFAIQMSSVNACLLMKVWDNGDVPKLEKDILAYYKTVKSIKPNASRGESSEKFLLARNFIGLEQE